MADPLSPDLRLRIIRAVEDEGMRCRGAAGRFGVAPSTAIELVSDWRSTGICEAGVQGGDRRSARIEGHAAEILALGQDLELDSNINYIRVRNFIRSGALFFREALTRCAGRARPITQGVVRHPRGRVARWAAVRHFLTIVRRCLTSLRHDPVVPRQGP